jgi:lysophospholipid acyltransferase (LPLAT)-like uncharacterized protein
VIIAFWHNRLLMMPIAAAGRPICILNSQHRDGEIATRVASRWNVRSVRGSATRGAVAGFLSLVRAYREGFSLAVVQTARAARAIRQKLAWCSWPA